MRVVERGEHARLALEPRQALGVARELVGQDLDRDLAAELGVASAIHLAHAADAELREDLVDVYPLADQGREASTACVSPGRVTTASRLLR